MPEAQGHSTAGKKRKPTLVTMKKIRIEVKEHFPALGWLPRNDSLISWSFWGQSKVHLWRFEREATQRSRIFPHCCSTLVICIASCLGTCFFFVFISNFWKLYCVYWFGQRIQGSGEHVNRPPLRDTGTLGLGQQALVCVRLLFSRVLNKGERVWNSHPDASAHCLIIKGSY